MLHRVYKYYMWHCFNTTQLQQSRILVLEDHRAQYTGTHNMMVVYHCPVFSKLKTYLKKLLTCIVTEFLDIRRTNYSEPILQIFISLAVTVRCLELLQKPQRVGHQPGYMQTPIL